MEHKPKTQQGYSGAYRAGLSLLLYAEVETSEQADTLAQTLLTKLNARAPAVLRSVLKYWKIPSCYGFDFELAPVGAYDVTFDCLIALCPKGWSLVGGLPERSVVWNRADNGILLSEQVCWAHVELYYTSDLDPHSFVVAD